MIAFSIFGFPIYWYGIFYLISFVLVFFFFRYISHFTFLDKYSNLQDLLRKDTETLLLYAILGVLFGGRLGYVLIYDFPYYLANPLKILALHEGGMAFIGGIIGVVIAILILRRVKNLSWKEFWILFDCVVVMVPLGIILGRFGNFLNQEIYGIIVNPEFLSTKFGKFLQYLDIIHTYPKIDIFPRFNTNFIAILFEGLFIFCTLLPLFIRRIRAQSLHPGFLSGLFLVLYSFFRFFIEYLRQDSQSEFVYLFTKSQWFFIVFFVFGLVIIFLSKKNNQFIK